jgi:hypothetical protein
VASLDGGHTVTCDSDDMNAGGRARLSAQCDQAGALLILMLAVCRPGVGRDAGAAVGEYIIADLVDRVIKAPQSFCDALPGHVSGLVDGGPQADADAGKAIDHPVEQFPAGVSLPCRGGGPGEVGEVVISTISSVAPRLMTDSNCSRS